MQSTRPFFEGFYEGSKLFGESLSKVINFILLSLVYFFGVFLAFLITRFFKKTIIGYLDKKQETYWDNLNLEKKEIKNYYKQF